MQRRPIIVLSCTLLAFLALGVYRASERACLPHEVLNQIEKINDTSIHAAIEAEFFVSHFAIGDTVRILYRSGTAARVPLTSYYTLGFSIIQSFTALVFVLLGLFTFMRKRADALSRSFLFLTIALAVLVAHTTGSFSLPSPWISLVLETLFHLAYAGSGVLFLQFLFTFGKYPKHGTIIAALGVLALMIAGVTSYFFAKALSDLSYFSQYDSWLKLTRGFFAVVFITGLGLLVHAVRTRDESSLNKQLRWVLYGCTISIVAYILLWALPMIINARAVISEEIMLFLAIIAPITIAIGIVRHKLFDIDLIIRKSISYALVIVLVIGIYALSVTAITWMSEELGITSILPVAGAAILAALIFEPVRRKVFALVDRKFFRTAYDFREAQRQFLEDLRQTIDLRMLGTLTVERIQQLVMVERIGFFVMKNDAHRMGLIAHEGFSLLERHGVSFAPEDLKTGLSYPVALPEFVEDATIEVADRPTFERWKIALVIPMLNESGKPLGFLVLGKRRSETRFSSDDLELLSQIAGQAAIALDRLLLQQKLLLEQAESHRLDELNRLKSYFVSSVTHDLKTPLTSIRLYAELLRGQLSDDKRASYLSTIEGETERLARLVTNVLDFARIEQGTKAYAMRPVDLASIVRDAIDVLRYQIESAGFALSLNLPEHTVIIKADRDAITGVIINLVSNALKYSDEKKCITIELGSLGDTAELRIEDHGIGMSADAVGHMFEPFYRVSQNSGSGAGLGLAIVKHTLDAHAAEIQVTSALGVGTTFTITFSRST